MEAEKKKFVGSLLIPVILLTAKSGDENQIIGLKTGADAYLSKPYNPDLLKVTIENLIANRKYNIHFDWPEGTPESVINRHISMYPNPSKGKISLYGIEKADVYLYSVTGTLLNSWNDLNEGTIQLGELNEGIYMLKVVQEGKSVVVKKLSIVK